MSADYKVQFDVYRLGSTSLFTKTIHRGDAPVLPEILDGLTIGWQFPESNLWPIQPDPVTASFSLIAYSAADLAFLDRGLDVRFLIWAGLPGDWTEDEDSLSLEFFGRITDLSGHPVKFGDPVTGDEVDGWQVDVIAVDPVALLAEYTVAGYYQLQGVSTNGNLLARWDLAEAPHLEGFPPLDWTTGGFGTPLLVLNEGLLEPTDLATATERILAAYADGGIITGDPAVASNHALYSAQGWRRGIIRPNVGAMAWIDSIPFVVEWVSRRNGGDGDFGIVDLPAVFALLGSGLYGPRLETPPVGTTDATLVIDAGYLDYGATWTRTKFDDPNTVDVANNAPEPDQGVNPWSKVTARNIVEGESIVTASITDALAVEPWDAAHVAEMYLDDSANADTVWAASGFRWYASQDPAWPVHRSLFPDTYNFRGYSAPVVITGIPANHRPDGKPWYVGVPKAVQWTFLDGEFDIAFDLYPRTPKPVNEATNGLTWAELGTDFPAVDWTDLDPSFTWIDYRLVRSIALT